MVITGPNTGGKTVAEKTAGLLCMMAQCGLHIPAEKESRVCMRNAYLAGGGSEPGLSAVNGRKLKMKKPHRPAFYCRPVRLFMMKGRFGLFYAW